MGEVLRMEEYHKAKKPHQKDVMAAEVQNTELPVFYGTKEVAQFLGCSIPTAREIMRRRDFPAIYTGRIIRVYKGALEKWAMERRT